MKKIKICFTVLLLVILCGCSKNNDTNSKEEIEVTHTFSYDAVDLSIIKDAVKEDRDDVLSFHNLDEASKYVVNNADDYDLVTNDDIKYLTSKIDSNGLVTKVDAIYEIDLLYRLLKSAYAPFYYFGDEAFINARDNTINWLNNQPEPINTKDLSDYVTGQYNFMLDGHSHVQQPMKFRNNVTYFTFYDDTKCFNKDENGFYQIIDDEKWYYTKTSDTDFNINLFLLENGDVVYCPIILSQKDPLSVEISLSNDKGETFTEKIFWKKSKNYAQEPIHDDICYYLTSEDGVYYVSERSFESDLPKNKYEEFVNSAKELKKADVIICDLRSNGGGSQDYLDKWFSSFTGISNCLELLPEYFVGRSSKLAKAFDIDMYGNSRGFEKPYVSYGKTIKDTIPMIVLVDNNNGSCGEQAMNYLKTLENTIVVGCNTGGYQLGGNTISLSLPKTQLSVQISTKMSFIGKIENVDGIGYKPDIYVNPSESLSAVINMINKYYSKNVALTDAIDHCNNDYHADGGNGEIYLAVKSGTKLEKIQVGQGFGNSDNSEAVVFKNGEITSDFEIINNNEDICNIKVNNGTILFTALANGDCNFIVKVGSNEVHYRYHIEGFGMH